MILIVNVASGVMQASALSPLVVSLSLTRKVPRLFCRFRRSLSESRRVIFPKYHLPERATKKKIRDELLLSCWSRRAYITIQVPFQYVQLFNCKHGTVMPDHQSNYNSLAQHWMLPRDLFWQQTTRVKQQTKKQTKITHSSAWMESDGAT